jgi:hypothetical protein
LRSLLAVVALTAALAPALAAQAPRAYEFDLGPIATWARRSFYGGSLGIARRPGGQSRVAAVISAGSADGRLALRVESSAQFLVTPAARSGVSPYAGLGVAYVGIRGVRGSTVLLAVLGVEGGAGLRHGWFAEAGLGGGTRVRLGFRWRALPSWWP